MKQNPFACLWLTSVLMVSVSFPASTLAEEPVQLRLTAENTALDASGERVALSEVMRGPAVLVKTVDGCPPCEYLVDWALNNAAAYTKESGVQLVVLKIYADEPLKDPRLAQSGTVALYTPEVMLPAPLNSKNLPVVLFFDSDLALTGEHAGLRDFTPEAAAAAFTPPRE